MKKTFVLFLFLLISGQVFASQNYSPKKYTFKLSEYGDLIYSSIKDGIAVYDKKQQSFEVAFGICWLSKDNTGESVFFVTDKDEGMKFFLPIEKVSKRMGKKAKFLEGKPKLLEIMSAFEQAIQKKIEKEKN